MTRPAIALLAALAAGSCGPEGGDRGDEGPRSRGTAQVGGEIVSTIDGHPIRSGEVARAAERARVPARTALARLEDEAILALAAERNGAGTHPSVERARRQAMVQVLLARTVEAAAVEVDPATVEAAYQASTARFTSPERRTSAYVLARAELGAEDAAQQRWIAEVHAALAAAPDPVAEALAIRRRALSELPFEIAVEEHVPGLARDGNANPAYLEALFAMGAPGVAPAPVRTELGWHVVVLTRVEPARATSREEALEILRAEREAMLRAELLGRLTMELAGQHGVSVESEAATLLENPRILGPAR